MCQPYIESATALSDLFLSSISDLRSNESEVTKGSQDSPRQ